MGNRWARVLRQWMMTIYRKLTIRDLAEHEKSRGVSPAAFS